MPVISSQPVTEARELSETWRRLVSFLASPQLQENVFLLKIVFIGIVAVFLVVIIYFLLKSSFLNYRIGFSLKNFLIAKYVPAKRALQRWQKIQRIMARGGEANFKLAVIEAGRLLQNTLRKRGYGKENLLWQIKKLTKDEVTNLDDLMRICQIYQNILRDPDYRLSEEAASQVIETIETTLKDLEVF